MNVVDQNTHKVTLSVWQVEDVICALNNRSWGRGVTNERRHNCWKAVDWLRRLIKDKCRIENVEIEHRRDVLEGIATAVIGDGLESVGKSILRQISDGD